MELMEATMQVETTFDHEAWRSRGAEIAAERRAAKSQYEESRQRGNASLWKLGDWLNSGERHLKSAAYDEAESITKLSRGRLYSIAWVARVFPTSSRRREDLSFSHYYEVASLEGYEEGLQDKLLEYGGKEDLSVREMQHLVQRAKKRANQEYHWKTYGNTTLEEVEKQKKLRPKRIAVWVDVKSAKTIRLIARAHKKQPGEVLADWASAYYTANLEAIKAEVKELEAKLKLERQQKRQQETTERPKRVRVK